MNHRYRSRRAGRIRLTVLIAVLLVIGGILPGLIASADAVSGAPVGRLDSVRVQPGGAVVTGWTFDPNTTAPISVHIYADKKFVKAVTANVARADVAKAYPGHGANHGYSTSITLTPGVHSVCTFAINVGAGAGNPQLGCKSVAVGGNPVGRLDAVAQISGGVTLRGWALDRDTTASISVHLYVDGTFVQAVTANTNRADIAAIYPGYGAAHGYAATLTLAQGTHSVCAFGINVGTGTSNPVLGCKTINLNFNPIGRLDSVKQIPGGISVAG
jgi:hypothetical protein